MYAFAAGLGSNLNVMIEKKQITLKSKTRGPEGPEGLT